MLSHPIAQHAHRPNAVCRLFIVVSQLCPAGRFLAGIHGSLGVNFAVWSDFGLIGLSLVLALVYGWACRSREADE
jgi:hypothetical protein